jgi:hypothetical protein
MRITTRLDTNATPFCRTVKGEFPISCIQPQTRREHASALDGVGHESIIISAPRQAPPWGGSEVRTACPLSLY